MLNAHFSVQYLDIAHFTKTKDCFGYVSSTIIYTSFVDHVIKIPRHSLSVLHTANDQKLEGL